MKVQIDRNNENYQSMLISSNKLDKKMINCILQMNNACKFEGNDEMNVYIGDLQATIEKYRGDYERLLEENVSLKREMKSPVKSERDEGVVSEVQHN